MTTSSRAGTIVLDIVSYWHAGTGRGDGPGADAIVARTRQGLPYLPGRTVKGLVRNAVAAAERAGAFGDPDSKRLQTWFGSDIVRVERDDRERQLEEARYSTEAGRLRFGSATLGEAWAAWAAAHPAERAQLVRTFASTRIGADGVALDETLRTIEISVPMTLTAPVEGLDEASEAALGVALPLFLRSAGAHRRRGLGRIDARLEIAP